MTVKEWFRTFDLWGLLILLPTIVCLLLALQWGGSKYSWNNGRIIALLVLFGVLAFCFVFVQFKQGDNAMVPFRILKQRTILGATWFAAFLGGSFFSILYWIPIWFQAIKEASATKSGIMNLPMVLSLVILSLVSGAGVQKLGYYTPWLIAASILATVGAGLLTTFEVYTGHPMWIGYQVIYGAGIGCGLNLTLIAVQTVLSKKDLPLGTSVVIFAQTLGGAIMVSIAQNVETNELIKNLKLQNVSVSTSTILKTGATNLRTVVDAQDLPSVQIAYNEALSQTFYVGVACAALSIIGALAVEWKSVKGKKIDTAPVA